MDYVASSCSVCRSKIKKYDFQKPSKIPYLDTTVMPTIVFLKKCRFKCYYYSKRAVAETSLIQKNYQIYCIINQKTAHKIIEETSMIDIAHQLFISTSTVIRKLNNVHFKHDFFRLPDGTSMLLKRE